jgi:hypothetical protein
VISGGRSMRSGNAARARGICRQGSQPASERRGLRSRSTSRCD